MINFVSWPTQLAIPCYNIFACIFSSPYHIQ
nr:MAG TPA: hypothetical protein [Caudoviricetes sp.]